MFTGGHGQFVLSGPSQTEVPANAQCGGPHRFVVGTVARRNPPRFPSEARFSAHFSGVFECQTEQLQGCMSEGSLPESEPTIAPLRAEAEVLPARTSGVRRRLLAAHFSRRHGVISRSEATTLGLSRSAVGRRVASGEWQRVHPEVYRLIEGGPGSASTCWREFAEAGRETSSQTPPIHCSFGAVWTSLRGTIRL
jgi:hypothetical protein